MTKHEADRLPVLHTGRTLTRTATSPGSEPEDESAGGLLLFTCVVVVVVVVCVHGRRHPDLRQSRTRTVLINPGYFRHERRSEPNQQRCVRFTLLLSLFFFSFFFLFFTGVCLPHEQPVIHYTRLSVSAWTLFFEQGARASRRLLRGRRLRTRQKTGPRDRGERLVPQ